MMNDDDYDMIKIKQAAKLIADNDELVTYLFEYMRETNFVSLDNPDLSDENIKRTYLGNQVLLAFFATLKSLASNNDDF
jgi:hypothetical protein